MNEEEQKAIEDLRGYLEWNDKNSFSRLPRDNHIETVLNLISKLQKELDKKDKVINLMAEELKEITGSCPLDSYDWENEKCDNCNNTFKDCFIEYFYKKVEEEDE